MTNEEMRRTMEFILEQQAQFAASMQRLDEERIRDAPRLARVEESFVVLVQLTENLDSRLDDVTKVLRKIESRLENVEASNGDHEARLRRVEDSFQILTQLAQKSDSRLDSLEATFGDPESRPNRKKRNGD